ncbi:MAG: ATP-binding cassette domain-containing protein [Propionibacterium sp.]|nr:ATP-binding cassette domain-containing protein [Propionibacterium sp.]
MGYPQGASQPIPPIQIRNLVKRFGQVAAVDDVSFDVHPGRVTGFLGPNGAGKTTTMRVLVGLAAAHGGTATFGGTRYADLPQPQRIVGTAIEANFHPGRSGRDHLRVLAATCGASDQRVDELLHLVDLTPAAKRRAGGYSMGMRQRLALAAALLGDPDYLILDEPANGLDPEGIRWLRTFLRDYASRGRVVLVSSHMLAEIEATADDLVVIGRGKVRYQGSLAQLELTDAAVRVRTADPARTAAALRQRGYQVLDHNDRYGPCLLLSGADPRRVGDELFADGIPVWEITTQKVDLEQNFFRMLGAQA